MRAGSLAISWEARFISSRSSAAARLGLGIEVGEAGHLDEFLLRLLEARDRIALPRFRLALLALFLRFPLRTLRALLPPRRLFLLGAPWARAASMPRRCA